MPKSIFSLPAEIRLKIYESSGFQNLSRSKRLWALRGRPRSASRAFVVLRGGLFPGQATSDQNWAQKVVSTTKGSVGNIVHFPLCEQHAAHFPRVPFYHNDISQENPTKILLPSTLNKTKSLHNDLIHEKPKLSKALVLGLCKKSFSLEGQLSMPRTSCIGFVPLHINPRMGSSLVIVSTTFFFFLRNQHFNRAN